MLVNLLSEADSELRHLIERSDLLFTDTQRNRLYDKAADIRELRSNLIERGNLK